MKALSIRQPWAWLIVNGYKDVENRTWPTKFRGRIYVHAGRTFDYDGFNRLCMNPWRLLNGVDVNDWATQAVYPTRSAIIGEVDIMDCITKSSSPWFQKPYGFVLANPRAYDKPIPCKGALGFFEPKLPVEKAK